MTKLDRYTQNEELPPEPQDVMVKEAPKPEVQKEPDVKEKKSNRRRTRTKGGLS